ncbi:GlxA family transcriptional regulator [Sphaerotilus mobilis]|uniref:Transcriptional regulator GlxA family with amidase domain n=1 Tax=Sphaerotilus mobilis TaxID=47994 RepID=A0A4Q7LG79_9BURK|nr:helix-turn-helix domain-containing protein [Sphaerotilus mobilis]RZS53041.1 transcriptional regulator GlxA family with amidase domain [Sphaerotilus mobilis]
MKPAPTGRRAGSDGVDAVHVIDVLFVVLPDTLLLDLAGPAEAFRLANQNLARRDRPPLFQLRHTGPLAQTTSSVGLQLAGIEPLPEHFDRPTWVVLMGRPGEAAQVIRRQRPWLDTRQWLARVVAPLLDDPATPHRLLTVCSGALLAADAGLVGTRAVTTHHELLDDLARLAPAAQVRTNRVFVEDGPLLTSAGITAGIDLALHGIAQVGGEALAAAVAQVMVVFHRRAVDDPERSPLLACRSHLHPAVHKVQNAVAEEPARHWTLRELAEVAHVTPRHMTRLFLAHAGVTPRDHVEQVRLAWCHEALAAGQPLKQARALAGFQSERQWRRARARAGAGAMNGTGTGGNAEPDRPM